MLSYVDDLKLLRREFDAESGSFLLQLRCDLRWDRQAFSHLEKAMRRVCAQQETKDQLDRWLVEGYWYLADFVPNWTSHSNFPRPEPPEYYEAALERLLDIQSWFVTGRSPYMDTHVWPDL
ncbi:hypothetical protein Ppa06_24090 [Planomonospora parontospora subsp. parontospora]|uniref:Uncharacterized protein n=2 Tax=Planomonospora parontospora TaxID=58119 RepID=A0AA37BFC6_9ACTN|nr:hypothetical protein GCM10010126_21590 [Planomonospora parontospora]GII08611.1 hypothetical protein Ppa06_24090 [Planomonospora parontospora subsp. parontospora]